ncbi:MAG: alpha/beta fold hydrolase [Acidimicrobiia bacterium]|nr:alpha/beta fold hydrolase [Acidimicrobiia bacterium]
MERIVVEGLGRLPQFAHAARAGQLLFVSGTLGTTEGFVLADGIEAQTTQTLANMGTILEADGASWDDVAKVNVFIADMTDAASMNDAYSAYFGDRLPPARITVGDCALALGALIEMDCVAELAIARDQPRGGVDARALPSRRSLTVERDGEKLYVEVVGEEHRHTEVPLVLSHGAGGNHAVWFQQVAHFARDRMVVTWDHRGFGRSTDRNDASGPAVASGDLLAVCDALQLARADLVGQSMGGWSVVGAALARPSLARSIVLADTLGGFTSDAIVAAQATLGAEPPGVDGSVLGLHPAIDPALAARDPALAHLYQSLGGFGSIDVRTLIARLLGSTRSADEAGEIGCPVLCLVGDRDPLFAPAAVRLLATALPDARVAEIPGSGHSPYFEDAEAWNMLVGRFLDEGGR